MSVSRILIVDDDPALLQALPETLRLHLEGVVVETTHSAASALKQIAAIDYDAIVTDIKMPGMDGLALLAQIRVLRPDTPTLLITGHGERDLTLQSLRGGAYDFIQKPIDRDHLIASLRRAIQVRQLKRQVEAQRAALAAHTTQLEQIVQTRTLELREAVDRIHALTEVATSIHAARGVGQVLEAIAEAAYRLAGAEVALAGFFRYRPDATAGDHWCDAAIAPQEAALRFREASVTPFFAPVLELRGSLRAEDLPPRLLRGVAESPLRISSYLAVPIQARGGQTLGAIVLGNATGHRFEDIQEQIEGLARQAAVALENAVLYEHEHGIAETLQRSLLPERLPEIPGIHLAARYLPGLSEAVGGDWYDVLELDSGQVGLVMGDVAGRGVWAASIMGQLRNALRAYALDNVPPASIGDRLNRFIDSGAMATLFYLVYDPHRGVAHYISFGHLPPLVIGPDGSADFLGIRNGSPPLGTLLTTPCRENSVSVAPGSTFLLYTDGLVEVKGKAIDEGLARLKDAVTHAYGGDLNQLLDQILATVLDGGTAGDDVAILALQASPVDPRRLRIQVPALPSSLPKVRYRLRQWLEAASVASEDIHEILVASGEACGNVVAHAYGPADGVVQLNAELTDGRVGISLVVRDAGQWRPTGSFNPTRGTLLMRALMDSVDVVPGPNGTKVQMWRRLRGESNS